MNEDFRYMLAISEHGSISKAARAVHITQPGLSQRLKRIESQMGAELFDRTTSPMRPTASGLVYLKYAERALAAEENMRREVFSAKRSRRQSLRIGVSMSRANSLLPEVLVSFYESHRGCAVELHEMSSLDHLHDLFLGDDIDFAVLTPIAPDPQFYETEVLFREQLVVAVREDLRAPMLDAAREAGAISLRQLEGMPLVLPTCGRYFDPLVSRMIEVTGVQLDVAVRYCSTDLALDLVEEGMFATIAPSTALVGHDGLLSLRLKDADAGNILRYIRKRESRQSAEERLFMDTLRGWIARKIT